MSHAASTASPALHKAKRTALQRFRSPERLAAMVAAKVPTTTGHRARDPSAIRTPADTPAAGQKTATPSGLVSRARLSRAATKYTMPTATASPIQPTHRVRSMDAEPVFVGPATPGAPSPHGSYLAQESHDLPLLHAKRAPKLGNSANEMRGPGASSAARRRLCLGLRGKWRELSVPLGVI